MKVQEVISAPVGFRIPISARESAPGHNGQQGFQRHMNDFANAEYEERLKQLREKIERQGEVLKARMDINELDRYRRLISELIAETASNAYRYLKFERFGGGGDHRIYAVIRKVNRMLEQMTQELLSEQSDQLLLLEMADDIRGLLVDLFL